MSAAESVRPIRAQVARITERGWRPFPCKYGDKRPAVGIHWPTATASAQNAKMLDQWFGGQPVNIGIACRGSNLVILDEDEIGGMERLCEAYGQPVPLTYRVKTAKGWHWYFDAPDWCEIGNSPGPLEDFGFDVRGTKGGAEKAGGYVVGAGSMHKSGHIYEAEDDDADTVELPVWIAELLLTEREDDNGDRITDDRPPSLAERYFTKREARDYIERYAAGPLREAREGRRNKVLNDAAMLIGHFVPALFSESAARRRLMEMGREIGLDDAEIGPTVRSGLRAGMREPYTITADFSGEDQGGGDEDGGEPSLEELAARRHRKLVAEELEKLEVREEAKRIFDEHKRADRPSIAEGVIDDLDSIEAPAMLVGGLIPELCVGWLAGRSGAYKSFLATAWGCCIATGRPWLGKPEFGVRRALKTLYVAAEGAAGAAGRIRAWEAVNGISRAGRLLLYPRPIHLNDRGRAEELAEYIATNGIEFLIIDTFRRSAPGVEDNSTTEVGLIFEAVAGIRDDHGCGVLMLDHTGHAGERLRGASGKGDDGDYVLKAGYEGESRAAHVQRRLSVLKLKDWESDAEWPIVLDEVDGQHFPVATIGEVKGERVDPDDWSDQLKWPLPADVMTLEPKADKDGRVRGREAVGPLAMFMRQHAPKVDGAVGISRVEAVKEIVRIAGHGERSIRNAWSALVESGRLSAATGVRAPTGRHVWVAIEGDPKPVDHDPRMIFG